MLKEISGGVCAPKGFKAAGVYCGVKSGHADAPQTILPSARGKNDLAMILSECECSAAAVYTLNRVKAAPIYVTMGNLEDGVCRGIVANSGNANACAPMSHENAEAMCQLAAQATGLKPVLWDERRTTVDAHRILFDAGKNGKKRKKTVDAVAASLILEGYLEFRRMRG